MKIFYRGILIISKLKWDGKLELLGPAALASLNSVGITAAFTAVFALDLADVDDEDGGDVFSSLITLLDDGVVLSTLEMGSDVLSGKAVAATEFSFNAGGADDSFWPIVGRC
uniref:Uncharacterized protein n=1 Tax=Romanomermis culicivorax TaxID=13658 RepID=A0A915HF70_ROMCU